MATYDRRFESQDQPRPSMDRSHIFYGPDLMAVKAAQKPARGFWDRLKNLFSSREK